MFTYFNAAIPYVEEHHDTYIQTIIANGLGINARNTTLNYNASLAYFQEALQYADASEDKTNYYIILSNMTRIYYLRNDPSGMKYALEVYEGGSKLHNDYVRFLGALNVAPCTIFRKIMTKRYIIYLKPPPLRHIWLTPTNQTLSTGTYLPPLENHSTSRTIFPKSTKPHTTHQYRRTHRSLPLLRQLSESGKTLRRSKYSLPKWAYTGRTAKPLLLPPPILQRYGRVISRKRRYCYGIPT